MTEAESAHTHHQLFPASPTFSLPGPLPSLGSTLLPPILMWPVPIAPLQFCPSGTAAVQPTRISPSLLNVVLLSRVPLPLLFFSPSAGITSPAGSGCVSGSQIPGLRQKDGGRIGCGSLLGLCLRRGGG